MLRKDFTVDEYQIYQARLMGANAVLLIVSLLDGETLKGYLDLCRSLGLAALVETHDGQEADAALERRGGDYRGEQPESEGLLRGLQ